MSSLLRDVAAVQEGDKDEPNGDKDNQAHMATDVEVVHDMTTPEGRLEEQREEDEEENAAAAAAAADASDDDSEDSTPFEPFDINNDDRIVKTASRCARESWKRPGVGWDVAITVHRFRELCPSKATDNDGTQEDDANNADEPPSTPHIIRQVEPDSLQLEFRLGEDEDEGFPQKISDQAKAVGVELHPLLHCGIATMAKNERATFVVTAEGVVDGAEEGAASSSTNSSNPSPCRRFEYEISLDDWMEEIDLSERNDNSLMKRVVRDGDGVTRPSDIGGVTVRCRVVRVPLAQEGVEQKEGDNAEPRGETVVFDNLQSQDEAPSSDGDEGLKGPLSFALDDCPFGPGVMAVVKSMSKGEQCDAWLDPKYGPVDHLDDGHFYHKVVVELVDVEELPPVFAAEEIRQEMSSRFKLEGNEKFIAGDYSRALRRYEKAIKYADGVPPGEGSEDGEGNETSSSDSMEGSDEPDAGIRRPSQGGGHGDAFLDLKVAVLCNQAACFLKMGDGPSALDAADRACSLKPIDVSCPAGIKAAYRRACALEAVGDWGEARCAFKSVLNVEPKNSQCRQGLARLACAEKAYEANLRKTFGGCLASNKLKGFASEGREVAESSPRPGNDDYSFLGSRSPGAEEDQDGPWTEGSESETASGDETSSNGEDDDEEKARERVDALHEIATGGAGGGVESGNGEPASLVQEENATAGDATTSSPEPGKEVVKTAAAPESAMTGGQGSAPSSEPSANGVASRSSLPDLAKEFAVIGTPSKESGEVGEAMKDCSKIDSAGVEGGEAAIAEVGPL